MGHPEFWDVRGVMSFQKIRQVLTEDTPDLSEIYANTAPRNEIRF